VSIPAPRENDPEPGTAGSKRAPMRYPLTSAYLCLCVTLILLAVLFEWRI
jgi:hypothetical protein